jgi:hypothetical protein
MLCEKKKKQREMMMCEQQYKVGANGTTVAYTVACRQWSGFIDVVSK